MTWTATQTVSFSIDVTADIEAKAQDDDYGVPGSPVWTDYSDHDFMDLVITIAGVDVKLADLPRVLQVAILEAAIDACDDEKWGCYE